MWNLKILGVDSEGSLSGYCVLGFLLPFRCYELYQPRVYIPAGTWRKYNITSTSMQRHDVASTLRRSCIYVICPLGIIRLHIIIRLHGYKGWTVLTLKKLFKINGCRHSKILLSHFKIRLDFFVQIILQTIQIKCQILFSLKNDKNIKYIILKCLLLLRLAL